MPGPRSFGAGAAFALALALAACASTPQPVAELPDARFFCADVQRVLAQTSLPVENRVHADFDAFVLSKPSARPLETQQYATAERISCKVKTADHLRVEYGPALAGTDRPCSDYNRRILEAVLATSGREARRRAILEPDQVERMGPEWLKPYEMVRTDPDGSVRIRAKSLLVEWLDPSAQASPPQFRGTHYCHLIAPEHLRALLTAPG
jgi:hypothetical protein